MTPRTKSSTRQRLDVFPYTVFAVVRPAEIVIVALAHQRQEPGYWADRLDDVDS